MSSDRHPAGPPQTERRRPGHLGRYDGPERRAGGRGHSGYGMESIRRYLRAQLELHSLLRPAFPPPPDDDPGALFSRRLGSARRRA